MSRELDAEDMSKIIRQLMSENEGLRSLLTDKMYISCLADYWCRGHLSHSGSIKSKEIKAIGESLRRNL